jgi:hypothetical protein
MSTEEMLTELATYKQVSVKPAVDVFANAPKLAQVIKLAPKDCLGNSYNTGKKTKSKIIEGLVLMYINDVPRGIFGHCWNKIDNICFDFTMSFAQPVEVSVVPGEKSFVYFEKSENSHRKYYKKAKDRNLSWFTESIEFGRFLNNIDPKILPGLFRL